MFKPEYEDTLDVWDIQLVQYGRDIIRCRQEFIEQLNELISGIHHKLSGGRENLRIVYDPKCIGGAAGAGIKTQPPAGLKAENNPDRTSPRRYRLLMGDIDIRKFGSQGQQRTAALSLKLAEIELVKKAGTGLSDSSSGRCIVRA